VSDLTDKQEMFISEYLVDFNATRAAKSAGYSEDTARSIGCENLTKPDILAEIEKRMAARHKRLEISADRILDELRKLAFANMQDYIRVTPEGEAFVDLGSMTREQAAAIQEIKVDESAGGIGDGRRERVQRTTFKLADKGINLERLGRYHKMFTERVEHAVDENLAELIRTARQRTQNANG
jgi:phage terminase small subunit